MFTIVRKIIIIQMSHTHGKFLYLSIIKANEKRFAFLRHFYAWNIWWEISLFWTSAHLIAFHIVNKQSIFCGWVVMLILKNIFIFFRCLIIFYLFVTFLVFGSLVLKRFDSGTCKASNEPCYRESPSLLAGPRNKSRPGEDV